MMASREVEIVEVALRDGIQSIQAPIATETKIGIIKDCVASGLCRIEIGSIVSPRALPQMSDIFQLWAEVKNISSLRPSVLVPNIRGAELAREAQIPSLVYVVSASQSHNQSNTNRSIEISLGDLQALFLVGGFESFRLDIATAFHCPFEGWTDPASVFAIVDFVASSTSNRIEIALCDTTGRATPGRVASLFSAALDRYPDRFDWAYHPHDTYGLGMASMFAAYFAGVRTFDASLGGIGGCPFAPGALGNLATEDVVFAFNDSGVRTGLDIWTVAEIAKLVAKFEGGQSGGHVRDLIDRGIIRPPENVSDIDRHLQRLEDGRF